jgi:hypothetical protein
MHSLLLFTVRTLGFTLHYYVNTDKYFLMITTNSLVLFTVRTLVFTVDDYLNTVQLLFNDYYTFISTFFTVLTLVFTIINYYCTFFI